MYGEFAYEILINDRKTKSLSFSTIKNKKIMWYVITLYSFGSTKNILNWCLQLLVVSLYSRVGRFLNFRENRVFEIGLQTFNIFGIGEQFFTG
jgi:hypothetical protein